MNNKYILFIILIIASVFRLYQLGNIPPSPNWDEAALGYNAYSILLTGKDEYGKVLPIILRSFDDYKPALYAYLTVPSVALFGLNVFAVRLPSAIAGIIAVLATYFLIKELFKENLSFSGKTVKAETLALLTALFLAISPWHIQFSRTSYEANVGLLFNILFLLFFLKSFQKVYFIFFSAFFAGISLHVYQSEKVFVPFILLMLTVLYYKKLFSSPKKYLIFSILIGSIIVAPLLYSLFTNEASLTRARGVAVFADQTEFLKNNVSRLQIDQGKKDNLGKLFDNRRVLYARAVIDGYLSHFDLNWLFIHGDLPRHHAPNMGNLYLFELPFLFVGIYILAFGQKRDGFLTKSKVIIFLWILLTPIPASFTRDVPHAVRTINYLPMMQILIVLGLLQVYMYLGRWRNKIIVKTAFVGIFGIILLNIFFYVHQYFNNLNYITSLDWQYGYKEAVSYVNDMQSNYKKIIVTNKPHLDQSYMFFLFYLKYPPTEYHKESIGASGGFRENHIFNKYEFRPIDWRSEEKSDDILYVGRPGDFGDGANIVKTINFINGDSAIVIVKG